MTESRPPRERLASANDRLKDRWETLVGGATLLAVALHVAAFGLTPSWGIRAAPVEATRFEGVSLVALPPLDALTGSTGALAAPLPLLDEEEEDEEDDLDGLEDAAVLAAEDAEPVDLWDAIGERLRRRGALVPTLAEPEDETESEAADGEDGDATEEDPSVGGTATSIDVSELPEPSSLDLDRLSDLRPELALQMASAWVLIRNPAEVETFLRRGYLEGPLDPSVSGSVSVTLWIDQRGSVQWAEVSESSGRQDLDEYALELFNEVASFKAAREDGVSVSRSVTLSLNFPW